MDAAIGSPDVQKYAPTKVETIACKKETVL